ncbi:histone-fold-containing protein [Lanmaoa asiatica]|nr:histone-fold-containing protein [Lanmaoa asiatica]
MSPTTPYVQPGEPLNDFLRSFWQRQVDAAEQETPDYRHPPLPLARIKKVMKSDPDVKMIAADAPILFCKACEGVYFVRVLKEGPYQTRALPRVLLVLNAVCFAPNPLPLPLFLHLTFHSYFFFISEITARAFIIADSNKRRTLSRADIAKALAKSDQFDFLIDIVPREEGLTGLAHGNAGGGGAIAGGNNLVAGPSQPAIHQEQDRSSGGGQGSVSSSTAGLDQASMLFLGIVVFVQILTSLLYLG